MCSWTSSLENDIKSLVAGISELDFVKAIKNGTLPEHLFRQFLIQDYHYLNAFKTSLLFLANRLPEKHKKTMLGFAYDSVEEERSIQNRMTDIFHFSMKDSHPSPVVIAYAGFERTAALSSSIGEALAAMLPCFWLFFEIMKDIAGASVPDNKYRPWIEAYANPLFEADTLEYRAICDFHACGISEYGREKMKNTFLKAVEYERLFWMGNI